MSERFGNRSVLRGTVALAISAAVAIGASAPASSQTIFQKLFPRITGGGNGGGNNGGNTAAPDNSGTLTVDPKVFVSPGYCPELRIPLNGENFALYDAERSGEPSSVRFMGSIIQTARECLSVTDTGITLKLGIAGRVVAGPKGKAGKVTMPIRITAVKQHGNTVLFNKTYSVNVNVGTGDLRADFAQVIDPVTFKRTLNDEDIIIYVGFDHPQ